VTWILRNVMRGHAGSHLIGEAIDRIREARKHRRDKQCEWNLLAWPALSVRLGCSFYSQLTSPRGSVLSK